MADLSEPPETNAAGCDRRVKEDVGVTPVEENLSTQPRQLSGEDVCRSQPKFCGRRDVPGRQLFISHPDAAPVSRPDCYTLGLKGYGQPVQHPLYRTSNATYGLYPAPAALNNKRFPRNSSFSNHLAKCGMYQDIHFTTEQEAESCVYSPTYE